MVIVLQGIVFAIVVVVLVAALDAIDSVGRMIRVLDRSAIIHMGSVLLH